MTYKFLEHTADLKILATGKNIEDAFSESAKALKEAICGKIKVKSNITREVKAEGRDLERVLYEFLESFLYLLDAEDFILSKVVKLKIIKQKGKLRLEAKVIGDKSSNYKFSNDVKAITFNQMKIEKSEKGVEIVFVVDV